MPKTYTVWSLDVWGNEQEGFDVNDRCKVGTVELPEDATDNQIVRAMVEQGYLTSTRFHFEVDACDDVTIYINHEPTGRPLLELDAD